MRVKISDFNKREEKKINIKNINKFLEYLKKEFGDVNKYKYYENHITLMPEPNEIETNLEDALLRVKYMYKRGNSVSVDIVGSSITVCIGGFDTIIIKEVK